MTNKRGITIAGRVLSIDECIDKLRRYPSRTLLRYDLPGRGDPNTLNRDDVTRTRAVSSRISEAETNWFLDRAKDAPWPSTEADDLRQADPSVIDGPYDQLVTFYNHFSDGAPRGIGIAKISKVLHVKRPAAYPILDKRITSIYRDAAAQAARRYPQRGYRRANWAAIRDDLIANTESGALEVLRVALDDAVESGARLTSLTDLRLLDILTWR
ncbi:DUF6308 family protein [Mycobacterium sp. E2479]|uniref:DUF6308 family protein n=1 Tax=Mycobacterium sp. E2479 TaxID=1834134 RepID=UPI0007FD3DB9|nr:DUF6308 family protein [Mycobacterium sp. E2479]OBH51295.1 hypothetical protein A5686_12345 [Mycobacterium sp. E2479]